MKQIFAIAVLFHAFLLSHVKAGGKLDSVLKVGEKCQKTFNLKPEDFNGDELSDNTKCYMDCIGEEVGLIVNGKLNMDPIAKLNESLDGEISNKFVDSMTTCFEKASKSSGKCVIGYAAYHCMFKTMEQALWMLVY